MNDATAGLSRAWSGVEAVTLRGDGSCQILVSSAEPARCSWRLRREGRTSSVLLTLVGCRTAPCDYPGLTVAESDGGALVLWGYLTDPDQRKYIEFVGQGARSVAG